MEGLRVYRRVTGDEVPDEVAEAEEKAPPRPPRRKKERPEQPNPVAA
jgi:hypothetical protein